MKILHFLVQTGMFVLLLQISPPGLGQNKNASNDVLARRVTSPLKGATIQDVLVRALVEAGVPGGVAVSEYCGRSPVPSLRPFNSSLRGLLDAIVSADARFSWQLENGIVELRQHDNKPLFLETAVLKFTVDNVEAPNEALNRLMALPEVQRQAHLELGRRSITGGIYGYGPNAARPVRSKSSIALASVTVREALNSIARAHGAAVWVLIKEECPGKGGKGFSVRFVNQ